MSQDTLTLYGESFSSRLLLGTALYSSPQAMLESIHHRGPDERGTLINGPVAMGMTRLSIIALAGGSQPMSKLANAAGMVSDKYMATAPVGGAKSANSSETSASGSVASMALVSVVVSVVVVTGNWVR